MATSKSLARRRWSLISGMFAAALLAVACGGGGDTAGTVGTGGTGGTATTFSAGGISGFGSVVVHGVRFDDTNSGVADDDGAARARDELMLRLGVEAKGGGVQNDAPAGLTSA